MADSNLSRLDVRSNHQAKHVDETMSHPYIASAPRSQCSKDARGIGHSERGSWVVHIRCCREAIVMSTRTQAMVGDYLFIKRSIDICLPCYFCTLSSRAQPRCVCSYFVELQIIEGAVAS